MSIDLSDFIQQYKNVMLIATPSTNSRKRSSPTVQQRYVKLL